MRASRPSTHATCLWPQVSKGLETLREEAGDEEAAMAGGRLSAAGGFDGASVASGMAGNHRHDLALLSAVCCSCSCVALAAWAPSQHAVSAPSCKNGV